MTLSDFLSTLIAVIVIIGWAVGLVVVIAGWNSKHLRDALRDSSRPR